MIVEDAKNRRALRFVAWAACLMMIGSTLHAQSDSLPGTILSADTLTDAQKQEIDRFVSEQVNRMAGSSSASTARAAREAIVSILDGRQTKAAPKAQVLAALGKSLPAAFEDKPDHVRLMAMNLALRLPLSEGLSLFIKGVSDPNPGVRYWSAKGLAEALNAPGASLSEDQQKAVLAAISGAMGKETAGPAFEQMTRAVNKLTVPEAIGQTIGALRGQVAIASRGLSYSMVIGVDKTLDNLSRTLAQQTGAQVEGAWRDLAAVSGQYLILVALQMAAESREDEPDESLQLACIDLVQTVEQKVLANAVRQLGGGGVQVPASMVNSAKQKNWGDVGLKATEWVGTESQPGVLGKPPINIPYDKLRLP